MIIRITWHCLFLWPILIKKQKKRFNITHQDTTWYKVLLSSFYKKKTWSPLTDRRKPSPLLSPFWTKRLIPTCTYHNTRLPLCFQSWGSQPFMFCLSYSWYNIIICSIYSSNIQWRCMFLINIKFILNYSSDCYKHI